MAETQTGIKNKPVDKVIAGNVSVAVWENEIQKLDGSGSFIKRTYTPQKFFTDKEGNKKNSDSFDLVELLKLDAVIQEIKKGIVKHV